ncbi:MAG: hypothetical protein HFJ55_04015 [Clostridia bacterium]|jgi:hypothetical protein|nr:hypothetical protein [Clostridia bacterium]
MEDTSISIIGILLASVLMFIVPLIMIADRNDDISQLTVQTVTAEFVDQVIRTGKITAETYQQYINSLEASGNTYDIDIEIKMLDKNTAQRFTSENNNGAIGPNSYYSIFTSQIEDRLISARDSKLDSHGNPIGVGQIILKEGDIISITTRNSSMTMSQTLKNIYYKIKGEDLHIIAATGSGTIAVNGAS